MTVALIVAGWLVAAVWLGVRIGRAVRRADEALCDWNC